MTSLAVHPLQRTITDMTDEDICQAPVTYNPGSGLVYSSLSFTNNGVANAELSQILNVPDNFFENYSRRNGSTSTLNTANNTQGIDNYSCFGSNFRDTSLRKNSISTLASTNSFNTYGQQLHSNLKSQASQASQGSQASQTSSKLQNPNTSSQTPFQQFYQTQSSPTFVQPSLIQRTPKRAWKGRFITIDDPVSNLNKPFNDDYSLFNMDLQASQMGNKSFFEDALDSSLYISSSDYQNIAGYGASADQDYMQIDEFCEDAEVLSEVSDDDNCFQDDFDEVGEYRMSYESFPNSLSSYPSSSARSFASPVESSFMKAVPQLAVGTSHLVVPKLESQHDKVAESEPEGATEMSSDSKNLSLHSHMDRMHLHNTDKKSGAEITATNPEHWCELVNPSNGKVCKRKFSRSYDLIRHQETIHATEKKIYRCVICEGRANGGIGNGISKTFSRNDALSRHIKVKHGLGGQEALDMINEAKDNVEYVMI